MADRSAPTSWTMRRRQHSCEEVHLTSAEPCEFVRVTLLDARDALDRARADQIAAADAVEAGRAQEAFGLVESSLGLWQAARQALDQGAQLVGLDLSTLPADLGEILPGAVESLARCLEEVRRCVGAQDWSGLSDLLRYDLDELARTWQRVLERVADHLGSHRAS
ncbi:MAG: hypothetical protein IPJ41_05280 [Phycisphaerales bacterium]|nr:hypothetical protein [Phycisphaerales bacterium]